MTTIALRHACRKSSITSIVRMMPSMSDCQTPLSDFCV